MPHCTFVREGQVCRAPAYQDPCPACIAYARSLSEQTGKPGQVLTPVSVNARASAPGGDKASGITLVHARSANVIAALHRLFHHLWTKNVGGHEYDKREWEEFEGGLGALSLQLGYQWPAGGQPDTVETAEAATPDPATTEPPAAPAP